MELTPSHHHPDRQAWLRRFWPWLVVALIILSVDLIRFRLLTVPLERDEGEYAYAGQLILHGIPPYELAYNMKLPGTYYAYAAGMAVFGQTIVGVHLTLMIVNNLACLLMFILGRRLGGVLAGLGTCASYAALSLSPAVLGRAAHATQFVVLFAIPGVLFLWDALVSGRRRAFLISGLLFGLAFVMKQPGLCFGLFGLAVLVWRARERRELLRRESFLSALAFAAGLVLPFCLVCLEALAAGNFQRFWFWTFEYASTYAGRLPLARGCGFLWEYLSATYLNYLGFVGLVMVGLVALLRARPRRRELAFAVAWLGFGFVGTASGLYFRNHYFVLMLPAFALLVGLALGQLDFLCAPSQFRWVPPILLVAVLAENVWENRLEYFELSPRGICATSYYGNPFLEAMPIAQFIHDHSNPDARVAVVGSEPEVYFYSQRMSATGYIYTYALMEPQPYAKAMQEEMIAEIEAVKPEFLVYDTHELSWLRGTGSDRTIFKWVTSYVDEDYAPVAIAGFQTNGVPLVAYGESMLEAEKLLPEAMTLYQRRHDPDAKSGAAAAP